MRRLFATLLLISAFLVGPALAVERELVNTVSVQTLTNKTLTAPTISSPVFSGTITGTYTLAGTPTFTGGTFNTPSLTTADITLASGTVGTPSLRFASSPTTGLYRIGADRLGISTAGVNALEVSATQNLIVPTAKTLTVGSNVLYGSVADKLNAVHLAVASQAIGDILQADAATTFARLAAVADGNVLRSGGVGTASLWGKVRLSGATTDITGTLAPGSGGTGLTSYTKGDLLNATGASTLAALAVGSDGTVAVAKSMATAGLAYAAVLNKVIYGLTYDNGTDATNDININTGGAMDATGAYWMTLATALGKQSDVAWAVGGTTGVPAGCLDTGAVGNSDYYIWLIVRSDTGVVDALCSLSSTAPTMPASYDYKRLIGWFKRVGGTVVAFKTYEADGGGLDLLWSSPTLDVDLAGTLTTTRRTDAVKVPLNFSVIAKLNIHIYDASAGWFAWINCPDHTDVLPDDLSAPLANAMAATAVHMSDEFNIRTSATGTIAARIDGITVDQYQVSTLGFHWARRN